MADVKWLNAFDLLFGPFLLVRSVRLPPSPRLRRTAVALAEAGQADRDHGPARAGHYVHVKSGHCVCHPTHSHADDDLADEGVRGLTPQGGVRIVERKHLVDDGFDPARLDRAV